VGKKNDSEESHHESKAQEGGEVVGGRTGREDGRGWIEMVE
jgi:hypothetical protein